MLDTNIVIYIIKNKPEYIRQRFNQLSTQLCVSSITVAELIYGAKNSQYPYKNMEKIEDFLSRIIVLDYDSQAGLHYGEIKAELRQKGKLISDNDIHIAGHARSKGLIVVTNNTSEFERVSALQIENWINVEN